MSARIFRSSVSRPVGFFSRSSRMKEGSAFASMKSSARFTSQLQQTNQVMLLVPNLLKKELASKSALEVCLALDCLANIMTLDLARDLIADVFGLLNSSKSIKKGRRRRGRVPPPAPRGRGGGPGLKLRASFPPGRRRRRPSLRGDGPPPPRHAAAAGRARAPAAARHRGGGGGRAGGGGDGEEPRPALPATVSPPSWASAGAAAEPAVPARGRTNVSFRRLARRDAFTQA